MNKTHKQLWWAYLHTNGEILPKRYFSMEDLREADESPFVKSRTFPFEASSYEDALQQAKRYLRPGLQAKNFEKHFYLKDCTLLKKQSDGRFACKRCNTRKNVWNVEWRVSWFRGDDENEKICELCLCKLKERWEKRRGGRYE